MYGDAPNELPLVELETRWDYADPADVTASTRPAASTLTMHSLFGASKVAADVMVQEYGRYFGMPTVCFRGGCLTGPNHSGAELHGFLAYLARAAREGRTYRIYGYKGKQVRDNIHSYDVCTAFLAFSERPRVRRRLQPGRRARRTASRCSRRSQRFEELIGRTLATEYVDETRRGDHICYITDLRRFRADYPEWEVTVDLDTIFAQLADSRAGQLVP